MSFQMKYYNYYSSSDTDEHSYYSYYEDENEDEYEEEELIRNRSYLSPMMIDWLEWNELDLTEYSGNTPIPINTPSQRWIREWNEKKDQNQPKKLEFQWNNATESPKESVSSWKTLFPVLHSEEKKKTETVTLNQKDENSNQNMRFLNKRKEEDRPKHTRFLKSRDEKSPPMMKREEDRSRNTRFLKTGGDIKTMRLLRPFQSEESPPRMDSSRSSSNVSDPSLETDGFTLVKKRNTRSTIPMKPSLSSSSTMKYYLLCIHGKHHQNSSCLFAHNLDQYAPKQCRFSKCDNVSCEYMHRHETKYDYVERMMKIPNSFFERNRDKFRKEYFKK